jgi:hypothetical protein
MGLIVDVVTANNLVQMVKDNIKDAFSATDKGVKEVIDAIIKQVGKDKITALRIWGHGITHYRDDSDYPNGNVIFGTENLDFKSIDSFEPLLRTLTPYFTKPARVELRGCQPAKGNGKEMMKRLAKIWNVEIHGSEKSQFLITWNPPVYIATPDGRFAVTTGIEVYGKR